MKKDEKGNTMLDKKEVCDHVFYALPTEPAEAKLNEGDAIWFYCSHCCLVIKKTLTDEGPTYNV